MSLVNTLTQQLRAEYRQRLDKYENRPSQYGVKDLFMQEAMNPTGILSDSAKELIDRSFGNANGVAIPVIDGEDVTIGNVQSCTVPDSENTSNLITLTFVPYSFGFTMTPAQHANNDIKYQEDFTRKLKKYTTKLAATIDAAAVAQLEADKNTYFPTDVTDIYPVVGDAFQVPQAEKNDLFNQARAIMEIYDYYDEYQVPHNPAGAALVNRFINQGSGNAINDSFQFNGYDFGSKSNRIVNNVGVESTFYVINEGSVALWNRNTPESLAGMTASDGTQWDIVNDVPYVGLDMGVKTRSVCADKSALGGGASEASMLEEYQWYTEVVYLTSYNSDPVNTAGAISKFEVLQ